MSASVVPRCKETAAPSTKSGDGPWLTAVTRTLESGRAALADPTSPSRDALAILLTHLSTNERVIAEAVKCQCSAAVPLAAYKASSVRLRRMLHLLQRTDRHDRGAGRFDASTLRRSLIRQVETHADIERDLIARFEQNIPRKDAHTFAQTYEGLMTQAMADHRSGLPPDPESACQQDHGGRPALIRAAQRVFGRRRARP
jgi:hypothetical protein